MVTAGESNLCFVYLGWDVKWKAILCIFIDKKKLEGEEH